MTKLAFRIALMAVESDNALGLSEVLNKTPEVLDFAGSEDGSRLTHHAALGRVECTKELISRGASFRAGDTDVRTWTSLLCYYRQDLTNIPSGQHL